MRRFLIAVGLLLLLLAGYLSFAPTHLAPVAWTPPAPMPLQGPYALNDRLASAERLLAGYPGVEAVAVDPQGRLVSGLLDGRVIRYTPDGKDVVTLANTGGRPLGLRYHPDGRLYICDAQKGLLALDASGKLETLASREGRVPVYLADDLAISPDGTVYFSDASARFTLPDYGDDIFEHSGSGRLLRYSPATKEVSVVLEGLTFANGVTFGPDPSWLLVAETGSYALWKVHVSGERAGQKELFAWLPGFPDNVTWSPERRAFWVAMGSPRNPLVDGLAGSPGIRKMISRLPKAVQPAIERHAMALALDEQGRPLENLQHRSPDSYSPVASVLEHEGYLYVGSFLHDGLARLKLPAPQPAATR